MQITQAQVEAIRMQNTLIRKFHNLPSKTHVAQPNQSHSRRDARSSNQQYSPFFPFSPSNQIHAFPKHLAQILKIKSQRKSVPLLPTPPPKHRPIASEAQRRQRLGGKGRGPCGARQERSLPTIGPKHTHMAKACGLV